MREMGAQILELREAENTLWSYTENYVPGVRLYRVGLSAAVTPSPYGLLLHPFVTTTHR
jgi:hypothetical protein